MAMSPWQHPVLVVGLDGATFQLLRPWLESGDLPCLSRLYREGVAGPLESVVPALSPEAWSTFMTGTHPGRHGIMNFLSFKPGGYELRFNNGGLLRRKTLWRLLSDAGKTVGVIGVPMTYPPEPVNGYLVTGLETPGVSSNFTYPRELREELNRVLGGYDIHGDMVDHTDPQGYLDHIAAAVDDQAKAASYLLERYPADLTMVVIGATDRAQHCFWKYVDPAHPYYDPKAPAALRQSLYRVYQHVDAAVEAMIGRLPDPKSVLIMSDHGFGPCHKAVHLERWLEQQGYLARSPRRGLRTALLRKAWAQTSRRAPRWLKDWLKSRLPGVRGQLASVLITSSIDWTQTRLFAISTQESYLYLNRSDRFPSGRVSPGAEAEALCAEVSAKLADLKDPDTGEAVVERICRTRDLYPGPALADLPDLIVLWRGGYSALTKAADDPDARRRGADTREIVSPLGTDIRDWTGSHRRDGVLIAHGPDFTSAPTIEGARLIDLAPTILHLLGQPVPEDMSGRVLTKLFRPEFLQARPVAYGPPEDPPDPTPEGAAMSVEDEQAIADRLRDLGYMG
jgi:predicted AlkP superfamily phosphohydrolase/phosphomutase